MSRKVLTFGNQPNPQLRLYVQVPGRGRRGGGAGGPPPTVRGYEGTQMITTI